MKKMKKFLKGLKYVREEIYFDLPVQHLILFITVADQEGITMPELSDQLDMPQGTVSRAVKAMSSYLRDPTEKEKKEGRKNKQQAGHGLLTVHPDLYNRKVHAVHLTRKGHEAADALMNLLYG